MTDISPILCTGIVQDTSKRLFRCEKSFYLSVFFSLAAVFFFAFEDGFSQHRYPELNGFVRPGIFPGINEASNKPDVNALFTDLSLTANYEDESFFKVRAAFLYRYGLEFGNTVSDLRIRESYISTYGKKWDFSAGQKIIRWGRSDFTNPTSKLSPSDFLLRTPDREEIYMGNILAELNYRPSERTRLQLAVIPLYRSSKLIIDPVPLPVYVNVKLIDNFITKKSFSYGIRADFYLSEFDFGVSWFDGLNPMPGIALSRFEINNTAGFTLPLIELSATPYRIRMAAIDFEAASGAFGMRGEAALSMPVLSYRDHEYVPLPSFDITAGGDWSTGKIRLSAEYYGRFMYNFRPSGAGSIIGTDIDITEMVRMLSIPGFDLREYTRSQIGTFNRLFNYQGEQYYHSAGFRIEGDLSYGKLIPSILSVYNLTAGELLLIPEIRFKPSDGLTFIAGAEYYKGESGSLYQLIDSFMNSLFFSIRADF